MEFVWVKGHAGHPENERCDRMAVEQRDFIVHNKMRVCVVNRCDPLDEKMPEIRYNVL